MSTPIRRDDQDEFPARLAPLRRRAPDLELLTEPADLQRYGTDWTRRYDPAPLAVALPRSVAEVAEIVGFAYRHRCALVPSGGRTGLSGGAVAAAGELVVALERMNRILDFDPIDGTVTVEAGVVTERVQEYARERGLSYPVDFAARGSSQIGGNVATNAGGVRVLRYGPTRDWVAGLKVVTGRGEVLELNRGLVKNATGYDLRHLFVGSEGTLGIIVEVTLRLTGSPPDQNVMLLAVPELGALMRVFETARARLRLSAFEFFSDAALTHVLAGGQAVAPFAERCPHYALLEFDAAGEASALEMFESWVQAGWVADGVLSQSAQQAASLWALREHISERIAARTPYKNDVSVRVSKVPPFLDDLKAAVATHYPDFETVWYGHIGDGNLHLNILRPEAMPLNEFQRACERVDGFVYDLVRRHQGSVSAEHGVGLLKRAWLGHTRSPEEIAYLRAIRAAFDPRGILNPGKLLR